MWRNWSHRSPHLHQRNLRLNV
ncbi:hypothetical protein DNTS_033783 [Danionella cerebrum]|uniref:Uncharacterized protein n=1 Tax=Danionella cerebrum TaxID=2873325 RepID=A0A553RK48_9TELE|nr:hypothetical protein DNTS_033783 [Danionella translucida]